MPNAHYFTGISNSADLISNFHNVDDIALKGWAISQRLFKPSEGYNYYYEDSEWYKVIGEDDDFRPITQTLDINVLADRYAIFSYGSKGRSAALGADGRTAGEITITGGIDLVVTQKYTDADEDHSAQFRSTNYGRRDYYLELLKIFGITVNEL